MTENINPCAAIYFTYPSAVYLYAVYGFLITFNNNYYNKSFSIKRDLLCAHIFNIF